jgi:hypothetical protein
MESGYREKCPMKKTIMLIVLVFSYGHAAFGQNLIDNGTFDTDVTGWETTTYSTGVAEWEPALGQPPGALRFVGPDQIALTERCYPAVLGGYFFRADGYMETTTDLLLCSIFWALYSSDDCSGSFAVNTSPPISSWVDFNSPNQWTSLNFNHKNITDWTGTRSIRPVLNKFGDGNGDDACIYDNVYLEIQSASDIPAVSPTGLVLLVALTILAGLFVLRRRVPTHLRGPGNGD